MPIPTADVVGVGGEHRASMTLPTGTIAPGAVAATHSLGGPTASVPPSVVFQPGERVSVYSNSKQAWMDGCVERILTKDLQEAGHVVPAGSVKVSWGGGSKWIDARHVSKFLRKRGVGENTSLTGLTKAGAVAVAKGGGASASGAAICKMGCGRTVAPGRTSRGGTFDTCCKNCATQDGGHSEECNARASGGRRALPRGTIFQAG